MHQSGTTPHSYQRSVWRQEGQKNSPPRACSYVGASKVTTTKKTLQGLWDRGLKLPTGEVAACFAKGVWPINHRRPSQLSPAARAVQSRCELKSRWCKRTQNWLALRFEQKAGLGSALYVKWYIASLFLMGTPSISKQPRRTWLLHLPLLTRSTAAGIDAAMPGQSYEHPLLCQRIFISLLHLVWSRMQKVWGCYFKRIKKQLLIF